MTNSNSPDRPDGSGPVRPAARVAVQLSRVLRRPAVDAAGQALGRLGDVVVRLRGQDYPQVVGLVADVAGRRVFLPAATVTSWQPDRLVLASPRLDVRPFERRDGEVLLRADVLGHRLVDIAHARLVRAYDVQLTPTATGWVVSGLDTQQLRWWHRNRHRSSEPSRDGFRDWKAFEALIGHQSTVLVRAPFGRLRRLRAAQLADLLEDASRDEQAEILAHVHADPELEADVFEELDDHRRHLLASQADHDVADLLAHMRTDDAADALNDLPQRRRGTVLNLLPDGHRAAVRDLLAYNQTTAGGLMGLEYLALPAQLTAGAALAAVRAAGSAPVEAAVTIHLLTGPDRLVGTLSLVRLVQAEPDLLLADLADPDPVRVTPDTDLVDLTVLMTDHNLITLPVVDTTDRLLGVITVDDVLSAVIPDAWRDREPPTRPDPPRHATADTEIDPGVSDR